jgi:hypothetical protein
MLGMKEILRSILKVDYGLSHEAQESPAPVIFDLFAGDVDDNAGVDPGDEVDELYMLTTKADRIVTDFSLAEAIFDSFPNSIQAGAGHVNDPRFIRRL